VKLSISNIAWDKKYDEDMYEYLALSGFEGIEIAPTRIIENNPYDNLDKAREFKSLMDNKGLEISSMQSIWFGRDERIFYTEKERKDLLNYTEKAIDFASIIRCKNLVFGSPKNRSYEEFIEMEEDPSFKGDAFEIVTGSHHYEYEEPQVQSYDALNNMKNGISFFKEIASYAEMNDTCFSIEPNPAIYNTNFINESRQAFGLAKEIDSDGFKVNIDFGTIIQNNEDLKSIKKNISLVNHVHISEPYLAVIEKTAKHRELAEILKNGGYEKYVSIEMKNHGDIQIVKDVMRYVKGVFG
jgi:sugar phosphate isomerase/epimerase